MFVVGLNSPSRTCAFQQATETPQPFLGNATMPNWEATGLFGTVGIATCGACPNAQVMRVQGEVAWASDFGDSGELNFENWERGEHGEEKFVMKVRVPECGEWCVSGGSVFPCLRSLCLQHDLQPERGEIQNLEEFACNPAMVVPGLVPTHLIEASDLGCISPPVV